MLESHYKTLIVDAINEAGGKAVKVITGEFTAKGEPDIYGCLDGHAFVIEAKVAPNKPTAIQKERLVEWDKVGAVALVMEYPFHTPEHLVGFLDMYYDDYCWCPQGKTVQQHFDDYCINWGRDE